MKDKLLQQYREMSFSKEQKQWIEQAFIYYREQCINFCFMCIIISSIVGFFIGYVIK